MYLRPFFLLSRSRWVELLDLVHCQIVSTCSNGSMDAYLLRLEGGTEEGREVWHETGCIMVSDYVPPLQ